MDRMLHPIPEAAAMLGVGRSTVYRLISRGALDTVMIDRRRLVSHTALAEYVDRLQSEQRAV